MRILLIVDPCSAGEALRIGPYVSMIRRHYPSAYITLVANADPLRALERVEDIDRFVESKLYIYRLYSRLRVRTSQLWRWLDLVRQVGTRYDLAITFYWGGVLQHSLAFVACRGRRVGFTQYPLMVSRMLLSRQLGPFKWKESHPPQHAALLRAAGIEAAEVARPYISYSDEDKATITRTLQEHRRAGNERLIVLHPGSDWACQQWLQERWSELADALVTRYGATILFTGSASETAYVEDIQKRMKAPSISLTGKTTLAGDGCFVEPQSTVRLYRQRHLRAYPGHQHHSSSVGWPITTRHWRVWRPRAHRHPADERSIGHERSQRARMATTR